MSLPHRFACLLILLALTASGLGQDAVPTVVDSRLAIKRFAAEPDLATPTGIDVASDGRVFVVECHTHFRPDDYQGPEKDRIRVFVDQDQDGVADQVTTFFEGTTATMNLALAPDGSLLVATRSEIFRLRDSDGDGIAEQRIEVAHLETKGDYPHNGLSGFAFDLLGRIYLGFGENLGEPYDLIAANGDRLSGGGEGGSVFRINPDGTGLVRWARGFWNPFHLAVDDFGRLFVVDNDPDWRPPCRLLHIVHGGDYGYRFSFGRRGTHPFTAWFGGVPDRLGMVCGTGEAPSGLVSYRAALLPEDYRGDLLGTSWGLHTIERYRLQPRGATWTSEPEIIVKGGEDFRPVGIATAPDGSLFISDWVKRSYPLHGHGRIWNLHAAAGSPEQIDDAGAWSTAMQSPARGTVRQALRVLLKDSVDIRPLLRDAVLSDDEQPWRQSLILSEWYQSDGATDEWKQLVKDCVAQTSSSDLLVALAQFGSAAGVDLSQAHQLRRDLQDDPEAYAEWIRLTGDRSQIPSMVGLLNSDDDWLQQAAIVRLAELTSGDDLHWDISDPDRLRVGMACVFARQDTAAVRIHVPELLADIDEQVRWVGLRWIAEANLTEHAEAVRQHLDRDDLSGPQFSAVLATLQLLSGRQGAVFEQEQVQALSDMVTQTGLVSEAVRPLALRMLANAVERDRQTELPAALQLDALRQLVEVESLPLRVSAVRQLIHFHGGDETGQQALRAIASHAELPDPVRVEAVAGLSSLDEVLALASSPASSLRSAALQAAASLPLSDAAAQRLEQLAATYSAGGDTESARLVDRLLGTYKDARPTDLETGSWMKWLKTVEPGNPEAGEQLFFSGLARCGTCHQVDGRGGAVGPELSEAGRMSRDRLLESILQPSREVAPRFTAWMVETDDGQARMGLLQTERGGDQFYVDQNGEGFVANHEHIVALQASEKSLMPDALLERLTAREINDLLAYLSRLQ